MELDEAVRFADVPIDLEAVLGSRPMTVRQLLQLQPGSLLRLARSAGDDVELRAGGVLLASGEVLVKGTKVGLRLTSLSGEEQP